MDTTGGPKYASAVAVELWHTVNTTDYTVKINYHDGIFYMNQTQPYTDTAWRPITATVNGCANDTDHCPMDVFMRRSEKWIPTNWTAECALPPAAMNSATRVITSILALFSLHVTLLQYM